MELNEIFENLIKIEPKVVSIETLFNNDETLKNTKYDPDYQRNYVWDDEKATYFIESILLGTEIPPIIYFRNGDNIEIIDGRQRYQSILRFLKNDFKLKNSGLHKLEDINIGGKFFRDLEGLKDVFWDTKLRIIEFSFHSKNLSNEELEDKVKKEIFKRYNSGITPLKPTEIDKAYYFEDDLNTFIKDKLISDKVLFGEVSDLFYFEKSNIQVILKKIRQLLVQHQIPIKYYAVKKDNIISQYYEILSDQIDENTIDEVFSKFIRKVNILKRIKLEIKKKDFFYNRLVSECLFWAFSIIETEIKDFNYKVINKDFIQNLITYINNNNSAYGMDRSSFSKELQNRYSITADFFKVQFNISFENYLQTSQKFKDENKKSADVKSTSKKETSFDDLRINKPEPSSITIVDICRQMEKQRFLIRPPYQRNEVINKNKSSAIIESILLGIKLPPLFVFKREDGVSEVLDGQQRLLSILGFLKRKYMDEDNKPQESLKNGYSLSLKNGILKTLDGKNVDKLPQELVKKINNFDLWIIEINHRYNKDFEPIDLFLRLNSKPYPIKENTFEMWNSYIDKEITMKVKSLLKDHQDWFYFRKNNSRMENENIYTALIYFQFEYNKNITEEPFEYYKVGDKINFRIKSKTEITKILEQADNKIEILAACDNFNSNFIKKLQAIVKETENDNFDVLNRNLEQILNISSTGRRTQQSFYALWHFLSKVPLLAIINNKNELRSDLNLLFLSMNSIESKEIFKGLIEKFWVKYK
jgi:uncharacterized protein with ParB-like and HNH nuclease domain